MFKIGLVGTGIIADFHKKAIEKNSEVIITAVCDIDIRKAENAAEGTNASVYTDYKEMAEKESLDCVILNLPHFLHRDVTVYFLNKGISVLVEKPMANTVRVGQHEAGAIHGQVLGLCSDGARQTEHRHQCKYRRSRSRRCCITAEPDCPGAWELQIP